MRQCGRWLGKTLCEQLNCVSIDQLTDSKVMTPRKDVIAKLLYHSLKYNDSQNKSIIQLKSELETCKTELINSQQRVIKVQDELLLSKSELRQSLQSTVTTSVENTVKAEFVSYSAQLQKSEPRELSVKPETLKSVVRDIVEEEDRSRSLMVFGLAEKSDAQLCDQVSQVFEEIGEKPRIEASRLGNLDSCKSGKARPVKVTLHNAATVNVILRKAKILSQSARYSSVFIAADRSPAQRAKYRQLVLEVKEKNKTEPKMRHFIRQGKVCSVLKV